jgi:hypothetical protein
MSESATTAEQDTRGDDGSAEDDGKKRRPWKKKLLIGVPVLVVLVVVAVVVLGGSDKKKAAAGGELKAGKQLLLPLSTSGKLAAAPGQNVVGTGMVVRSIVPGQGFWVGGSRVNRVYVQWGAADAKTESGYRPGPSQKVDLAGPVRPAPADTRKTLKLSQEDAAKVTAEGAYINADKVSPAQKP